MNELTSIHPDGRRFRSPVLANAVRIISLRCLGDTAVWQSSRAVRPFQWDEARARMDTFTEAGSQSGRG